MTRLGTLGLPYRVAGTVRLDYTMKIERLAFNIHGSITKKRTFRCALSCNLYKATFFPSISRGCFRTTRMDTRLG